jgi:hypothetical protein
MPVTDGLYPGNRMVVVLYTIDKVLSSWVCDWCVLGRSLHWLPQLAGFLPLSLDVSIVQPHGSSIRRSPCQVLTQSSLALWHILACSR